ncbi:DUF2797 domain-containing protein [Agaribacter marinus]|uniref:DUF2797 domain-containing protein n=1 Tax=Agaribacter marinus TaxID=1431249 RepID=A0AA37WJV7_9ALTE|nr:DUF2797 domain-containing protein [Agaribacter marinus]GLR72677.1 hypothetical protein GCM10007852_35850 [Agaribacter marinus]
MPNFEGGVRKMHVAANDEGDVEYILPIGEHRVGLNALLGKVITIRSLKQIHCVHCGRKTNKSFSQGYCFPCMRSLAQCDTCIIKPEKCHYEEGTCREPQWGEDNCLQDHFVYLANTGAVKVGITRHVSEGVSSRWIDQGATQAMAIYRVKNRKMSGLVETAIAKHISDKTNWRTMLKGDYASINLKDTWQSLKPLVSLEIDSIVNAFGADSLTELSSEPVEIGFPVQQHPIKIKSVNLDKVEEIQGTLLGIKGQYLMFDGDRVFNVRNASGYSINLAHD